MRILVCLGLLVAAPLAHADRRATLTLGAMVGVVETAVPSDYQPVAEIAGGPRLTFGWEPPTPALPGFDGWASDVVVVPELSAAALMSETHGETMLGVGLRMEYRAAKTGGGMFGNARMSMYAAARASLIGAKTDSLAELAVGSYVYIGKSRVRFGGEVAVVDRENTIMNASARSLGLFSNLYLGYRL